MYAWTLWTARIPLDAVRTDENGKLCVQCKATDRSYNTQPESIKGLWNNRGLLNNSWHSVTVHIV